MMLPVSPSPPDDLAFCTIVSKNYISQARVLAESLRQTHPQSRLFVLLVDRVDGYFDPAGEPFTVVPIEELPIPRLPRFCFQYNILELNTAAKPYFLAYLLDRYRPRKLVYFDPDILVLHRLDRLSAALDSHNIVLTPHVTQPYPQDGKSPSEIGNLLLAGTFNLGFIGIAHTPTVADFLTWWQERLYRGCQNAQAQGMFVDQRWMDLCPHYFEGTCVLRDPGYNVAYWNMHYRRIHRQGRRLRVNGEPLYFMHFSGFDPCRPLQMSKYQDRLRMEDLGEARTLYARYFERLNAHGYEQSHPWPYFYDRFDNGYKIPDFVRRKYLLLGDEVERFGNPFLAGEKWTFFHWLTSREQGRFPPLLQWMYEEWPSLIERWRKDAGDTGLPFAHWVRDHRHELQGPCGIEARLLAAVLIDPAPTATLRRFPSLFEGGKDGSRPFGVNLAGSFEAETGVAEAARGAIRALEAAGIPYVLNNVRDVTAVNVDSRYTQFSQDNPYAINLIQVNADIAPHLLHGRPEYLAGRYNIGYWNWELAEFPTMWAPSFEYFDEIWAPSTFTQQSIAAVAPIPVRYVPFTVSVSASLPPGVSRAHFWLPPEPFVFLFAFDCASFVERKNPLAVVRAFERAFGQRSDVLLVLKVMHGGPEVQGYDRLLEACSGRDNIRILDGVYTRPEAQALMQLCDAYVSLHRCEGFGLTVAEAMAMGKPVIATAYSSTTDFLTIANSRPIRFRLQPIDRDYGPYRQGALWADPDLEHAAHCMRQLVEDPDLRARIAARAQKDMHQQLSAARVGALIYSRLLHLCGGVSLAQSLPPRIREDCPAGIRQRPASGQAA